MPGKDTKQFEYDLTLEKEAIKKEKENRKQK